MALPYSEFPCKYIVKKFSISLDPLEGCSLGIRHNVNGADDKTGYYMNVAKVLNCGEVDSAVFAIFAV